ncbi:MAG: HIRAN domain-containing protein [Methanobrevibacter sp.]|uniref:HIRAN domain-containing protein n=1 Tax=Methanobrevibacter sp. TaxID=66852 RepID=UPI0026E097C8|nr:HIRAN domain-containing protein [Methanobrevibacter sp.]MDO5849488.1 HIRAN domain-containing protein [Methanobrevibacter sp.]
MSLQKVDSEMATTIKLIHNSGKIASLLEDIFLIRVYVAGSYYYIFEDSIVDELEEGNDVRLMREANNEHDKKAIMMLHKGKKIGYVPRKHNTILSNLMDSGKMLYGRINTIGHGDYDSVDIMVDIFLKE